MLSAPTSHLQNMKSVYLFTVPNASIEISHVDSKNLHIPEEEP